MTKEFQRFAELARRLFAVSKKEVAEQEEKPKKSSRSERRQSK
jgi:hypothetical protein